MTTDLTQTEPATVLTTPQAGAVPLSKRVLPGAVAAIALLAVSAGVRMQMEAAVNQRIVATQFSPFDLDEIPKTIGPWKGEDGDLDPFIARKTGSTDYIMRRYTNNQTGAVLELLMLYGPAAEMGYHKPDACYPNAGYKLVGGGDVRPIQFSKNSEKRSVGFKHQVFQRGEGSLAERQQVYFVWKYSDTYALDLGQPSIFGRLPGMFKIQLSRGLAPSESADGRANMANPCEDFLARLMPIFESKLTSSPTQMAAAADSAASVSKAGP